MCSSSPVRIPKLQLTIEQSSRGESWILPKKETPCAKAKEKPQQDGRRGEITFRIKPHTRQKGSEASNKPCAPHPSPGPRDPTETETELCLSVSGGGTGQQGTASGAGALGAADLGMA